MALTAGTKLGTFEILAAIGAGGMGEVYRARDARLARNVALKVLPAEFAQQADRMARFEREAQTLASLNHPHIAALYGLEESGGLRALVMELVEGPTLAEKIGAGPVALEEALPLARQMAEALEYAHERGIIHRDLKPANIKITTDGSVKVLDFGLAKALEGETVGADLSHSPTISLAATRAGIILGTAAYMSPEQAKGKPVDRRADIWAFGVVLMEMLSGQRMYAGETASETMAAVIKDEPGWGMLPGATPEPIRRLLRRCLTKEPKSRLRDIGEARIALDEHLANPSADHAAIEAAAALPGPALPTWKRVLPWAVATLAITTAVTALWRPWHTEPLRPAVRLSFEAEPEQSFVPAGLALSPDGTRLVYQARDKQGTTRLYARRLDQPESTVLSGTENAGGPFFSPDGEWVAFFADARMKKISFLGGAAVTLCDAPVPRGGWWGEDGWIVAALDRATSLSRVPAAGGKPEPVTVLDKAKNEVTHRTPQVLPGGRAVLFTINIATANFNAASIVVQMLASGERKTLPVNGFNPRYLPSGHLLFAREGTIFAAPFDLRRLEMTGPPAPVLEDVTTSSGNGLASLAFASDGTLAYLPGGERLGGAGISWMDKQGKYLPLRNTVAMQTQLRFSPDGKRLALELNDGKSPDIWVYDIQRDAMTKLTFDMTLDRRPAWTPDGKYITFDSDRSGARNLYIKRADGAGDEVRLLESKNNQAAESWSPDGRVLAFTEFAPNTDWDIWTARMEGTDPATWKPGKPELFLRTQFVEVQPTFSPDGRWIAYASNDSGRYEIYVRPFPGPGGRWQISNGNAAFPNWSRKEPVLFYRTGPQIMSVRYRAQGSSFQHDRPELWSSGHVIVLGSARTHDLAADGKRFAVLKYPGGTSGEETQTSLTFVLNFFDDLRRKVPSGKQ